MMKPTALFFLSVLLLMNGGISPVRPTPESPVRQASFCPECWRFLTVWDLDLQGRCLVSGKKPVEAEAVAVTWFWCRVHDAWHRRECGKGFPVAWESTALLIPSGSESVTTHAYCPQDRRISDLGHAGTRCPTCAKPMVGVDTVQRTWFWCHGEKSWRAQPCPSARLLHCCTERTGTVLAHAWQVPLLGEVSFTPPVREDLRVKPEWLALHLDDPHLAVIHVGFDPADPGLRSRQSYLDGHIQGARSLAWGEISVTRNGLPNELPLVEDLVQTVRSLGLDDHDRIVLYDTGYGLEAARAYVTLDYLGLGARTSLLDGQWARWKALKLPESRMPEEVEPSAFVPKLHPEILVTLPEMKDLAWLARQGGATVSILDARTADEFSGYRTGKGIFRAGHIAGATNLCWSLLLDPSGEPVLLPEDELRAVFESTGARPGRMIVAYCRTGVESSLVYFAAKVLGYEARFYDGSYFEWSREEVPIEGNWVKR